MSLNTYNKVETVSAQSFTELEASVKFNGRGEGKKELQGRIISGDL